MSVFEMLRSSPAFMSMKSIYIENDLKNAADLMEKCLKWVPNQRITA